MSRSNLTNLRCALLVRTYYYDERHPKFLKNPYTMHQKFDKNPYTIHLKFHKNPLVTHQNTRRRHNMFPRPTHIHQAKIRFAEMPMYLSNLRNKDLFMDRTLLNQAKGPCSVRVNTGREEEKRRLNQSTLNQV